jgi:hypothetical protein
VAWQWIGVDSGMAVDWSGQWHGSGLEWTVAWQWIGVDSGMAVVGWQCIIFIFHFLTVAVAQKKKKKIIIKIKKIRIKKNVSDAIIKFFIIYKNNPKFYSKNPKLFKKITIFYSKKSQISYKKTSTKKKKKKTHTFAAPRPRIVAVLGPSTPRLGPANHGSQIFYYENTRKFRVFGAKITENDAF